MRAKSAYATPILLLATIHFMKVFICAPLSATPADDTATTRRTRRRIAETMWRAVTLFKSRGERRDDHGFKTTSSPHTQRAQHGLRAVQYLFQKPRLHDLSAHHSKPVVHGDDTLWSRHRGHLMTGFEAGRRTKHRPTPPVDPKIVTRIPSPA